MNFLGTYIQTFAMRIQDRIHLNGVMTLGSLLNVNRIPKKQLLKHGALLMASQYPGIMILESMMTLLPEIPLTRLTRFRKQQRLSISARTWLVAKTVSGTLALATITRILIERL